MQFKCSAHLYITLPFRTQCQTARETLQSQNSWCKNSSALIQKTQLCCCVCPQASSEQCLQKLLTSWSLWLFVYKGHEPWWRSGLKPSHSWYNYHCSSPFSLLLFSSLSIDSGWEADWPALPLCFQCTTFRSIWLPYCFFPTLKPNVQWWIWQPHSRQPPPVSWAAVSSPRGDAKAAPSPLCNGRQFLSQTYWGQMMQEGLEEAARASSSVFAKFRTPRCANGGSDLHAWKGLPSHPYPPQPNSWRCNISCWTISSFSKCGSKASKVKNFFLHLFETLAHY